MTRPGNHAAVETLQHPGMEGPLCELRETGEVDRSTMRRRAAASPAAASAWASPGKA